MSQVWESDAAFEHDRKVIFGIYIFVFIPLKALFTWNLKQLHKEAVEKDVIASVPIDPLL